MIYYLVLFAYTVLIQYSFRDKSGNDVLRMVVTFLPIFLFGALRVNCGDYEIYENYNNWVRTSNGQIYDVIERMEPGYAYLNMLLPYRWIIILNSLLSCVAYAIVITKLVPQKYRWFGFMLVFLVADKTIYFMLGSIRNSISISILLIYLAYRIRNREKKHPLYREIIILLLITFIAYLFHASALMFFPIAYVATINKKIDITEVYVWLVILVLLWIIPVDQIINETNWLVQSDYFTRYDDYIEETSNAGILAKRGATILALLTLFTSRKLFNEGKYGSISRLMLLYVYSYLLGSLNMRVSYYFIPFAIIYLTYVYSLRDKNNLLMMLVVFATLFLVYSSFVAGGLAFSPQSQLVTYKIALF